MQIEQLIERLNHKKKHKRLKALKKLKAGGALTGVPNYSPEKNINYTFKTIYSSFERTPSMASFYASKFGLPLVGIIDYGVISSFKEIDKACSILETIYYLGAEVHVAVDPKENGNVVKAMAIGVPHSSIKKFNAELEIYRDLKGDYCKALRDKLNSRLKKHQIKIEAKDVTARGQCFAEEKVYTALAKKIIARYITAESIIKFLESELCLDISDDDKVKLEDITSTLYAIDLAYIIKDKIKIKLPEEKLLPLQSFIKLCNKYGAISVLSYESGDETNFVATADRLGFQAVCVELDKVSEESMAVIYSECISKNMLPLCRNVIDHPRKKFDFTFNDPQLSRAMRECAMAVVGHEISTSINFSDGMFSGNAYILNPNISDRIKLYSRIGFKGNDI